MKRWSGKNGSTARESKRVEALVVAALGEVESWRCRHPGSDYEAAALEICSRVVPFGSDVVAAVLESPDLLTRGIHEVARSRVDSVESAAWLVVSQAVYERVVAAVVRRRRVEERPQFQVLGRG